MIVCVCNNINEEKIQDLIDNGFQSLKEIYSEAGATKRCGTCVLTIREIIEKESPDITITHTENNEQ